jgi:prepilin-type N-terminal cleavage/methylation domain-containing protein
MRKRGFTLVEIMIVILILGLLLGIALPQWVRARERSQGMTCVANLRKIRDAKEQFAMETNLVNGAPCTFANLAPDYIRPDPPSCPMGGTYTVGNIGVDPTCSIIGGLYPHVLP